MSISSQLPSRYKLDSSLGKGGFGEVYKAYDTELDKVVAIKILTNVTQESISSLKKEFEVLSKLSHPCLVKVYGYGFISDNIPYYTMEYIEGQDLMTFLSSTGAILHLPYIINQSLQALGYLHEKQIIHGDIKPENIFISTTNNNDVSTKILDFGLASTIQDSSIRASGTPRFMAPEILSHRTYSPASDLYALGITFIESITSMLVPAAHDINPSFYKKVHNKLTTSLASDRILNPSAIASFILNLSDKDPANRPENAQEALKKFSTIVDIYSHDIIHELDNVFVDRNLELESIRDFIRQSNIDTRVLILEGPTGIGKKALMSKAIAIAQPERYFVLDLSDPSLSRNTIERLIETISTNLSPSKRDAFMSRHSKILELVKTRSELDKSLTENMRVAYSNIISYLRTISGDNPIMLCVPDIERFSEDFYQFVDQLVHELHLADTNMRLIISRNTDKRPAKIISDALARSASLGYSTIIAVKPFTYNEMEELQHALFNGILFNKHQTKQIVKETDGTPLLIIEYIKHLLARGAIQLESGIWTLDPAIYEEVPIPGHIEAYINEEYSKCDQTTKHLLQLLAFWGRDISRDLFSELSGIPANDIDGKLMSLLDSMIIECSGNNAYIFKHEAYIKYIKARTSKVRAININASILGYLENTTPSDYERLATHSRESLSIDKSMQYVFEAVDLLEKRLEYHRCYELLSRQETLIKKHGNKEQLIKVLDRIAPIEQRIGFYDKALSDYILLLDSVTDNSSKAYYSKAVAHLQNKYFGAQNTAIITINNALSYADEAHNPQLVADLLLELGIIENSKRALLCKKASNLAKDIDVNLYAKSVAYLMDAYTESGDYEKAKVLEIELISLLDKAKPHILWHIYFSLHKFNFYTGNYDRAKYYTEQSIRICDDLCDEFNLIFDYNHLGGLYYIQGKYFDQIKSLKIAVNRSRKYSSYNSSLYLSNISLAYLCMANYREARKALQQANKYYNHLSEQFANDWVLTKYSHLYAFQGNAENEKFNKYLRKTILNAKRTNNTIVIGHTKLISGTHYYQRLQLAYALRNTHAALATFRKANDRDDIVDALRLLAMILIEKGDLKEASKAVSEARKIFDEIHCDYLKPQLLLAEGALARAQKSDTAEAKLKEALKTSKKMFTREYTWQIQRELALHHQDRGELHKALQYYRDAIDMIKEITETIDGEELKTSYLSLPFRKRVFDEIKALKKQLK